MIVYSAVVMVDCDVFSECRELIQYLLHSVDEDDENEKAADISSDSRCDADESTNQKKCDWYKVRRAQSIGSVASSDAGDMSAFSDEDLSELEAEACNSDADSDVEFERYLKVSANRRHKTFAREHHPFMQLKRSKVSKKREEIDDEYDQLPALEKLSIQCNAKLTKLGVVENIVGVNAIVPADVSVKQTLDLDSIIFDNAGVAIGIVSDVFGAVRNPLYCVRLYGSTEAASLFVGIEVFFAPTESKYTKTLIKQQLEGNWKREKIATAGDELDDDDEVFSDDEKERQFKEAQKAARATGVTGIGLGVGVRKRKSNRVQFSVEGDRQSTPQQGPQERPANHQHNAQQGRGRGNRRGGRGQYEGGRGQYESGRGRANGWQWNNQRSWNNPPSCYNPVNQGQSGSSPANTSPIVVPMVPAPSLAKVTPTTAIPSTTASERPTSSTTSSNPYAEFGCYGDFTLIQNPTRNS